METRANYVLVGASVLAAIACMVAFIFWLTRNSLNHEADTYYTYFTGSVAGLSAGNPVRYRGVPVGTVGAIVIDPDNIEQIRVTLKLTPDTPVRTDTVASLEMAGITGGSYVELSGGTKDSPPLKTEDEDQIPVIKAEDSSLQSLVADAPKLLGKLTQLADRANDALSPDNLKNIADTLSNLKNITASIDGLTPQAKEAMTNFNLLVSDLHTRLPPLIESLRQDGVSAKGAIESFHQVAGDVDQVIAENRLPLKNFTGNGLYEVTGLVTQLRGLTETLNRVADRLDRDPRRYLFGREGGGAGVDPGLPIAAGVAAGGAR